MAISVFVFTALERKSILAWALSLHFLVVMAWRNWLFASVFGLSGDTVSSAQQRYESLFHTLWVLVVVVCSVICLPLVDARCVCVRV